jgi:hypothetical protein
MQASVRVQASLRDLICHSARNTNPAFPLFCAAVLWCDPQAARNPYIYMQKAAPVGEQEKPTLVLCADSQKQNRKGPYPFSANPSTQPRPMPSEPPVMTAERPLSALASYFSEKSMRGPVLRDCRGNAIVILCGRLCCFVAEIKEEGTKGFWNRSTGSKTMLWILQDSWRQVYAQREQVIVELEV